MARAKGVRARARSGSVRALASLRRKATKRGTLLGHASREVSPEQKAIYHDQTGAGKSRVKRHFFDLSDRDLDRIRELLQTRVAQRLGLSGA